MGWVGFVLGLEIGVWVGDTDEEVEGDMAYEGRGEGGVFIRKMRELQGFWLWSAVCRELGCRRDDSVVDVMIQKIVIKYFIF